MSNNLQNNILLRLVQMALIVTGCFMVTLLITMIITYLYSLQGINITENIAIMKVIQGLNQICVFLAPSILFLKINHIQIVDYWGLKKQKYAFLMLMAISLLLVSSPLITWLSNFNEGITFPDKWSQIEQWLQDKQHSNEQIVNRFLQVGTLGGLMSNIIVMALLPAICEETFFRGCLQKMLTDNIRNKHIAVAVSAIIFSVAHFEFYGLIPRIFLGLIIGYIFLYTNNITFPIIFHFANNCTIVIYNFVVHKYLGGQEIDSSLSTPTITLVIVSIAITALGIKTIKRYCEYTKKAESINTER